MGPMNVPSKPSGPTDSQPPTTPTTRVKIRLMVTPSPSKSLGPSSLNNMPSAAETSDVATARLHKEPAPKNATSSQTKRSTNKADNTPQLSGPPKMTPASMNSPYTHIIGSAPQIEAGTAPSKLSTSLRQSATPKRGSPAPMKQSNTPTEAITPTKEISNPPLKCKTSSRSRVTGTPSPSREYVSLSPRRDSPSPAPTAHPATTPPNFRPSTNKRGIAAIPMTQILCCNAIRPASKAEKEGHDNLLTFIRSFSAKEVQSISSTKNVYSIIWQEFNFIVGINIYNPNTQTLEVKFYGGEDFSKGRVVEIAPLTRPIVLTPLDAEITNEECLIRVDCGIDFNCKSHGHWRFTAFFVKWQAPGEKDRWDKEERLRIKRKRSTGSFSQKQPRVQTANELCVNARLKMQMDGTNENIEDGGYVFSEDLFDTMGSSVYQCREDSANMKGFNERKWGQSYY